MIKEITIQNFQSHKHTTVRLHEGVNIVVGETDSGKSGIMRALRWLIWNRPIGEVFRSDWGGDTIVSVTLDTGDIVRRVRTNSENRYEINGVSYSFDNTSRTQVPEEISRLLNINEINFKSQGDDHFLIKNSPGEVAQHFNRVAHLSQIDQGLSNVDSWIRQLKQDLRSKESSIEEKETELRKYTHLDKFEAEVEVLEELEQKIKQTTDRKSRLENHLWHLGRLKNQIKEKSRIIETSDKVNELIQKKEQIEKIQEKQDRLSGYIKSLHKTRQYIQENQEILETSEQVNHLFSLSEEIEQIHDRENRLRDYLNRLQKTRNERQEYEKRLNAFEQEFHKYIGEICPLCGQEIKQEG